MSSPASSIFCVFVSALIAGGCSQKQTPELPPSVTCMLDDRVQARCYELPGLRVAVLEATVAADREPLLFIPGGPGQSAFASLPEIAPAFGDVRKHHDIIAFERDLPACPVSAVANPDDATEIANARTCADEHGVASALASTRQYVVDALTVMPERFAVYGASYGTRVALEIMRAHPERLTSVTLDGVIAPESVLGVDQIPFAEAALNALAVDAGSLLAKLPVDVVVREPRSGTLKHVWLTADDYEQTLRSALYSRELVALVPRLIKEADFPGIATLMLQQQGDLNERVSGFIYYSVVCGEDIPFATERAATTGFFKEHLSVIKTVCGFWPVEKIARRTAVVSDVPTLIISGERDPVTPPAEAERVARTLSQATLLTLKDEGHINVYRSCMPRLFADFVDRNAVDASCLERAAPLPVFTGVNGP